MEREDRVVNSDDRQRSSAAAAALADIERQQLFIAQRLRLSEFKWLPPAVAVVLAVAAASLAYRNGVLFVVVQVIYLAALILLLGTPVRAGVVPREGRRSRILVFVLCVVLLPVPQLAMLGPRWTAIAAGAGAAVVVVVVSRWRLAATLHEARRPPLGDNDEQHSVTDWIVAVPAAIVIAAMSAGALAAASPDRVLRSVGGLAYFLGIGYLLVVQQRIGVLPPALRAGVVRNFLLVAVVLLIPVTLPTTFTSLRGNWWVASCCALVTALTMTASCRWQRDILRRQARLAGPTRRGGADG